MTVQQSKNGRKRKVSWVQWGKEANSQKAPRGDDAYCGRGGERVNMADKKKLIDVASVATKLFIRYASPALAEDAKTLELPDNKYWGLIR